MNSRKATVSDKNEVFIEEVHFYEQTETYFIAVCVLQ